MLQNIKLLANEEMILPADATNLMIESASEKITIGLTTGAGFFNTKLNQGMAIEVPQGISRLALVSNVDQQVKIWLSKINLSL